MYKLTCVAIVVSYVSTWPKSRLKNQGGCEVYPIYVLVLQTNSGFFFEYNCFKKIRKKFWHMKSFNIASLSPSLPTLFLSFTEPDMQKLEQEKCFSFLSLLLFF